MWRVMALLSHILCFIDILTGRYTAREVRKRNTEIAIGIFVNDCYIVCNIAPQLNLMPDWRSILLRSTNRYIFFRVRHCHPTLSFWMPKLCVRTGGCNFLPSILLRILIIDRLFIMCNDTHHVKNVNILGSSDNHWCGR